MTKDVAGSKVAVVVRHSQTPDVGVSGNMRVGKSCAGGDHEGAVVETGKFLGPSQEGWKWALHPAIVLERVMSACACNSSCDAERRRHRQQRSRTTGRPPTFTRRPPTSTNVGSPGSLGDRGGLQRLDANFLSQAPSSAPRIAVSSSPCNGAGAAVTATSGLIWLEKHLADDAVATKWFLMSCVTVYRFLRSASRSKAELLHQ
jgi:hypothetical protein